METYAWTKNSNAVGPVNNVLGVNVIDCKCELVQNDYCIRFVQLVVFNNVVKQLAPTHQLHDHPDVSLCLKHIHHLDQMLVLQFHRDLNFCTHPFCDGATLVGVHC